MIIYNVTLSIEKEFETEVLQWMKDIHIPEVMQTNKFIDAKMFKILESPDESIYNSFAIQYSLHNWEDFESYEKEFAAALREKTRETFGEKILTYRTFLKQVYP
jgi:hypothetical protein